MLERSVTMRTPVLAGSRPPAAALILKMVRGRRIIGLGGAILLLVLAAAAAAPALAPYDPLDIQPAERLHRPAPVHPFGTDEFGRDILSRVLFAALVKRVHKKALQITGDSWGASEEELIENYRKRMRIPRPEEEAYRRALLTDPGSLRVNRGRFLVAIKGELAQVLGNAGEPFSTKHEWRYENPIGEWTIETYIDVGGRVHQLAYQHAIGAAEHRCLKEGVSIVSWLGIGGEHTLWDQLTEADTPLAVQSLSRICAHFMRAAPELLAGLCPS